MIRFYYDKKLCLDLKRLVKDDQYRKRAGKNNTLVALSKIPTESRSMRDNFLYQGIFEEPLSSPPFTETEEMRVAGKNWDAQERQRLIIALCRFCVLGPRGDRSWDSIAEFVGTKKPDQCASYYDAFKSAFRLDPVTDALTGVLTDSDAEQLMLSRFAYDANRKEFVHLSPRRRRRHSRDVDQGWRAALLV